MLYQLKHIYSWKGYYNSEDMKLICVYNINKNDEYEI
jgi:hypothetical protein